MKKLTLQERLAMADRAIDDNATDRVLADLRDFTPNAHVHPVMAGILNNALPLTSIGPSGLGGEYQSELHPDRVVTDADRAADRAIVRSGEASPEQLGLLRTLALRAVAGKLGGWERFNRAEN